MRSKEGEKGRFGMGDFFSLIGVVLVGDSGFELLLFGGVV